MVSETIVKKVRINENHEPLVHIQAIAPYVHIADQQTNPDLLPYVRQSVAEKLNRASIN